MNKNLIGVAQLVDDMEIASYSTEAKAKKAMEMLRNEYMQYATAKSEDYWFAFDYPKVFQFPADEDVEV